MAKKKATFRSTSRRLALEPRLLFDGAAAIAGADALDNHNQQEGQKDNAAHATPPAGENHAGRNTPAATTSFDFVEEQGGLSPDNAATLVVIDSRIPDYASLLDQLPAHAIVRVVDAQESGLDAIHAALAQGQFQAVHILSHGTPGSFAIGTDTINNETLPRQADALAGWATQLTADADILLYGCDIAQGEAGRLFINEVARLTSADISASTNATGSADKGGDWVLESATGSIEAGVLAFSAYGGVLAAPTVTDTAPADEPFSVGENTPKVVGNHITVTGTGADSLTVTASVTEGTLSASTFTGNAAAVQDWLASLSYTYTGTSQTGDSDTLTLSIVNNTNAGTTVFTRSITIAPENDAPVMTPPASGAGRLSVAEGSNAAFAPGAGTAGSPVTQINLGLTDLDNTQAQIILKLTTLPGQGVLKLNGNELTVGSTFAVSDIANLSYHHNGSQVLSTTTDTFQITVDDGAGGLLTLQTVTVDITPVNQAPSVGGDIVLIEGETGVKLVGENIPVIGGSRGNLTIADPDDTAGTHTVQITGLPAHGVLKYNGVAVSNGQTIANANLSLFTYDHDGSETTSDSFKIKVTDAGGGQGAGAAITTADQTVNLTIIPNNDDPYWNGTSGKEIKAGDQTVPNASNEFGTHVFGPTSGTGNLTTTLPITTAMLHVVDAESGPERLTYTLTSIPSGGYLTHSGYPGQYLPVGFTFTQAEIDAGKISFVNTTGNSHSTDFKFTVMDGDRRLFESERDGGIYANEAAATPLTVHTFKIEYQGTATGTGPGGSPPTAAPIPTIDNNLGLTDAQIAENQYFTLNDTYLKASSTGSTPEQITYRLLTLPSNGSIVLNGTALGLLGSFTQADINAGNVKFQHDGSEDFTASFTFDVSNGSQITAAQTFNIDTKPQNDMPVAGQGDTVKLTEGSTIVLNAGGKTHITLADKDNDPSDKVTDYAADNTLSFKVTVLPTQGTLEWNNGGTWQAVTVNQVITQADLTAGKLRYTHGGTENYTDNFTIVPLDDKNVASTTNNTDANANPPSGDPTNQTSEGAATLIQISVNPLNDAPTYVNKAEPGYDGKPALKEGTEFTIWGATYTGGTYGTGSGVATPDAGKDHYLVYQDTDNTSEQRQYRVTTATKYGTLTANGRVMGAGSVFTQAELDAGQVKYKHGGGEQFDDKFEYVVSDGDYSANQSTVSDATAAVQGTAITPSEYRIKLERANDKPTISTSHTGLFVVDSSAPANAKTLPSITLADIDLADGVQTGETNFVQVKVEFLDSSNAAYANGVLHFTATTGVALIGSNDASSLTFQGTLADVQTALNQITARTNSTDADLSNLKIKVTVDDRLRDASGNLSSGANGGVLNQDGTPPNDSFNTASITINVAASDLNDPPIVTVPSTAIVVHEDVRTQLTGANAITYTDPDAFDSTSNSVTLKVTNGKLYFHSTNDSVPGGANATGVGTDSVTLTGTKAQLDDALAALRYQSNPNYNGNDSLAITVNDDGKNGLDGTDSSGGGSSTGTVSIHILPVNDAPTLTLPGENSYQAVTGGVYEFSSDKGNPIVIADDADFGITGTDQQDGEDDSFTVTLSVSGTATPGTITLTTPGGLITAGANGSATVTLTGSRAAINAALAAGVTYNGAGNTDGTVTFTVTVNDQGNGGTALTDPEAGTPGIGGALTATKKLYLQPTSANDAPGFTGLDNTPTYAQGSATPIVLDGNALLTDPELDLFGASGNWNGAILTLNRDGGANANDVFGFTGSGNSGVNVSGSNLRIGTTIVGTLTNTGGTLVITFNTNATAERVDTVLQALTYKNTETNPDATVTINYTIDDQNQNTGGSGTAGSGQDQGTGGKLTGTGSITVTINRQVVAEPDSNSINEATSAGDATAVTGDLTPGSTNSNDHGGSQDRDPDAGQTITVQGVVAGGTENAKGTGTNGIADSNVGTTVTGTYGSIVINADGTYTYTLDNTNSTVNALKPGETLKDRFSYAINDGAGTDKTTAWSVLTITINGQNDPPVATDNVNSVTENTGTPATGNVRSDGTPDSDPDTPFVDLKLTQIVGNTTQTITDGSTSASGGAVVVGKYGTLTIGADGSYSYVLDQSNPAVNALNNGDMLTDEVFTYTLSDGDKTDTATLTITINGHTDGAPNIVANDGNGAAVTGQATVYEKGLTGGSGDPADKTTTGTITVQAPDGIASVTIGGTTFTVAQLDALSVGNPSDVIDTGEGELRITGISNKVGPASAPTSAEVSYTYTLKQRQDHSTAPGTESTDSIALLVTDKSATPKTATGTLTVQIIDDVPAAVDDTKGVAEGESVSDNVLDNDVPGADGWPAGDAAVVGVVAGSSGTPTTNVGTEITGTYGKLTLNADGSYTYVADSAVPGAPPVVTDVFTYTVRDADGDEATAKLTITVQNNRAPTAQDDIRVTPEDTPVSGNIIKDGGPGDVVDTDPDAGDVLTVTQVKVNVTPYVVPADGTSLNVTIPGNGTLVIDKTGAYTFTPVPDWNGQVPGITYTVDDGKGAVNSTAEAILKITVLPVRDIVDDASTTLVNTPVKTPVLSNDSFEGTPVVTSTAPPGNGSITVNPDGTITYTPNDGFIGVDSYTYTVTSGGVTETATVTVTVKPAAPPVTPEPPVVEPPVVEPPVVEPPVVEPPVVEPPVVEPPVVEPPVVEPPVVEPPVVEPPVPPVEPPAPPVEPPYIEPPTVPQSPYSPPPALVDSPQGLVTGDVAHMPGVFNDFGDQHRIVRMQIPLHPIIYVTREVADRQAEQAMLQTLGTDMGLHEPGQQRATSIGLGLGQDPTLYVQHAVRDAQREGSLWERLARKIKGNLSPLAPEPDLNPASDAGIPESLQGTQRPGQGDAPQAASDMPEAPATADISQAEHLLMQRWAQQEAAQDKPTRGVQPIAGSFQQQLQVQARKLPSRVS